MNKETCPNCKKCFEWNDGDMHVPGGKDREDVNCPWCGTTVTTRVTSGSIYTKKVECEKKPNKLGNN